MMREIRSVKQDKPGFTRRWFQSDYFDLFTFQDDTGAFTGFQLCYDVERNERAFSWSAANGFFHDGVDDAADLAATDALLFSARIVHGADYSSCSPQ